MCPALLLRIVYNYWILCSQPLWVTSALLDNDVIIQWVIRACTLGKKEIRVLLTGVEPIKTFRLLVRMLYHLATGDSWELRPLNKITARIVSFSLYLHFEIKYCLLILNIKPCIQCQPIPANFDIDRVELRFTLNCDRMLSADSGHGDLCLSSFCKCSV